MVSANDIRNYKMGNTTGWSYSQIKAAESAVAAQNAPEVVHGITLARPGVLGRTVADRISGKNAAVISQMNPEQQQQIQTYYLNEEARAGKLTNTQYQTQLAAIEGRTSELQHQRTIDTAQRAAPGLRAAAAAERERFSNISQTNFSALEQAQTKQLQKVSQDITNAGYDPGKLTQSRGTPNPRSHLKITTAAQIEQNQFAKEQAFRTVASVTPKPKSFTLNLTDGLSISGKPSTGKASTQAKPAITPVSLNYMVPQFDKKQKLEQNFMLGSPVKMSSSFRPPPKKKLTRGQARYQSQSAESIIFDGIGKVNPQSNVFRESQQIRKSLSPIVDRSPQQVFQPGIVIPRESFNTPSNAAAFVSGSKATASVFEKILQSSNISLKNEAIKITKAKNLPEVSQSDIDFSIVVPGTIEYALSENKAPLVLTPYVRELKPLENRADLIETVQRPILNLGRYIAAAPEGFKRSFETGDFFAGDKYFEKEIAPKMKDTASSRAFSGDWKSLFDPAKLPENLISAATEISMYAFLGGRSGTSKSTTPKIKIELPSDIPYVPKYSYSPRRVPGDIFKADKATPSQFKETKIELGKGIGLKFDPSSGGITIGKPPPGKKPPSTFTSTKTELGKGTGKLPTSQIITKGGQILLQQAQLAKIVKPQKPIFKSTPVRLGEAEAKIIKQIQKPQETPKTPTPKKKKPQAQTSDYIFQQETIRYPPTTSYKSEFKIRDEFSTMLIPKQTPKQQQQSFIVPQVTKQKQQQSFFIPQITKQKPGLIFKQTPKLTPKLDQPTIFKQTPKQTPRLIPVFGTPIIPEQSFTFTPPPTRPTPKTQQGRFLFPPFFPGGYFGSGGYEPPASLKKGFAAYGISSDINIKTLPTYSRYSAGTNIFKAQKSEDEMIQNLFYGKPRKKSTTKKKSNSKKKSRKK